MTRKTQRMLRRLFPYVSVLVIAALVIIGVALFTKKDKIADVPSSETETSATLSVIEVTETTTEEETAPTIAALDAVHVDSLIDRYYEAKINDDAEELNNIVDAETEYNVTDLANETQFIAKYDNFKTYSLPGPTDDLFIVYVRYDIYFNGINTGAPALNHFIVMKDSEGYYYISDQPLSGEFQAYLEETEKSDVVVNLKAEVEEDLKAACEANEDLRYLIQMLNGTDGSEESTEAESAAEAGGSDEAAESDAEGNTAENEASDAAETSETAADDSAASETEASASESVSE